MTIAGKKSRRMRRPETRTIAQRVELLKLWMDSKYSKPIDFSAEHGLEPTYMISLVRRYSGENNMFGSTVLQCLRNGLISIEDVTKDWIERPEEVAEDKPNETLEEPKLDNAFICRLIKKIQKLETKIEFLYKELGIES